MYFADDNEMHVCLLIIELYLTATYIYPFPHVDALGRIRRTEVLSKQNEDIAQNSFSPFFHRQKKNIKEFYLHYRNFNIAKPYNYVSDCCCLI